MGSLGGLLGVNGGANGTGFAGPAGAMIVNPTNPKQLTDAYNGVQGSMAAQNALLGAIQAQNGLQNQNQVYGQLQNVANGTGPNPAQAMLNQATGANVANQAALMAGQRGASQNVGLIARQAGQQGANMQQQAVGQGATMQANQSLNALGAAGNMANTQAGNQIAQTNANTASQQGEQAHLLNTQMGVNNSGVSMQSNVNNVNGQLANTTMQGQQAMIGGMMNSMGGLSSMMADGGEVDPQGAPAQATPTFGTDAGAAALAGSGGGKSGGGGGGGGGMMKLAMLAANGGNIPSTHLNNGPQSALGRHAAGVSNPYPMAHGGNVPAFVSPGERYLPPQEVQKVAEGKKSPMKAGEKIPGEAKVKGAKNSYANDTVPKTLEEGGIVIPRSITMAKDAPKKAADFVAAIMKKKALEGKS